MTLCYSYLMFNNYNNKKKASLAIHYLLIYCFMCVSILLQGLGLLNDSTAGFTYFLTFLEVYLICLQY